MSRATEATSAPAADKAKISSAWPQSSSALRVVCLDIARGPLFIARQLFHPRCVGPRGRRLEVSELLARPRRPLMTRPGNLNDITAAIREAHAVLLPRLRR
jgi:hypothetical protein